MPAQPEFDDLNTSNQYTSMRKGRVEIRRESD